MLEFSFSELILVGVVALIVLGPERLPGAARTAGRWVRQIRQLGDNLKQEMHKELNDPTTTKNDDTRHP